MPNMPKVRPLSDKKDKDFMNTWRKVDEQNYLCWLISLLITLHSEEYN